MNHRTVEEVAAVKMSGLGEGAGGGETLSWSR